MIRKAHLSLRLRWAKNKTEKDQNKQALFIDLNSVTYSQKADKLCTHIHSKFTKLISTAYGIYKTYINFCKVDWCLFMSFRASVDCRLYIEDNKSFQLKEPNVLSGIFCLHSLIFSILFTTILRYVFKTTYTKESYRIYND